MVMKVGKLVLWVMELLDEVYMNYFGVLEFV